MKTKRIAFTPYLCTRGHIQLRKGKPWNCDRLECQDNSDEVLAAGPRQMIHVVIYRHFADKVKP